MIGNIFQNIWKALDPFVITADVDVKPLRDVLHRNNVSRVDFLHIDTEGHDLEVLKTADLGRSKPLAIYVEHKHLSDDERKEMETILTSNGYDIRNAGTDFFAKQIEANKALKRSTRWIDTLSQCFRPRQQ